MQRDKEKERHRLFLPPLSGSAVVYLVRTGGALLHHSLGWGSGICVCVCVWFFSLHANDCMCTLFAASSWIRVCSYTRHRRQNGFAKMRMCIVCLAYVCVPVCKR